MNRALFSGVSGLKSHQTKMDVIGNNIANVNTYGYKAQRVIFSDTMYQAISSAQEGSSTSGGINPSAVGYGSSVAAIQTDTSQASMQSTSYGTDVAICGEGYYQVMDSAGNIFYTKAGVFGVDENGYMVDENGNFVLGANTKDGDPDSQKIQVNNVGTVSAQTANSAFTLNGVEYSLEAENATDAGNVSFTFASSSVMASGLAAQATISSTGAITITFNENESFATMADVNQAINDAITEANGGVAHEAGDFTLTPETGTITDASGNFVDSTGATISLTGADLVDSDFGVDEGSVTAVGTIYGQSGVSFDSVSSSFSSSGTLTFSATFDDSVTPNTWTLSATDGTNTYTSDAITSSSSASTILLKNTSTPDDTDYFEMTMPTYAELNTQYGTNATTPPVAGTYGGTETATSVASAESTDLGLGSASVTLADGTEGGDVDLSELTVSISSDGTVYATHDTLGTVEVGAISLANFANPSGLEQVGSSYFSATLNSGDAQLCTPGEDGTGNLKTSALEMSNVDLSSEMAEMITTQRGFQANSRVITVTDTMIEELVNLKR